MQRALAALMAAMVLLGAVGCVAGAKNQAARAGFHPAYANRSMPFTPLIPPQGFLFQQVQAPLSLDFDNTEANQPLTGSSTTHFVAFPFYQQLSVSVMDPASVELAARNGGIKEIVYADYETFNILGVYSRFTVNAYGR